MSGDETIEAGGGPLWSLAARVGALLALSVALLDLVRGVARQAVEPMSGLALIGPVAALFAAVLALYVVLLLLLEWPLRRWTAMDAATRVLSVAALLGVPLACRVLGWVAALPERGHPESWLLPLLIGGGACCVTRWAVEGAERRPAAGRWLFGFCLGAPVILLEALLLFWLRQQFRGSSLLFDGVGGVLLAAAALATASFFSRAAARSAAAAAVLSLTLLVATAAAWALGGRPAADRGTARVAGAMPHVILITIDTLRRDALSLYGSNTPTPHIDALAQDGIRFERAYSTAPWTAPSFCSIMTGVSPWTHEVRHQGDTMSPALPTLARRMHEAGYRTGAMGYNYFLTPRRTKRTLSAGFETYDFRPRFHRPLTFATESLDRLFPGLFGQLNDTDALTREAQDWVRAHREQDFFFWLHYFDPHGPYAPPPEFYPAGEPDPVAGPTFGDDEEIFGMRTGHLRPTPRTETWIRELYEGEVRYVDDRVGRFIGTLKELGLYDDALIVLTSDHGEELFDHGGIDHGHTLYEELLRVPLIVKLPHAAARETRVGQTVSTVSLTPTILDACALDYDPTGFEGASLVPLWQDGGPALPDRPVFSTGLMVYRDRRSVVFNGYKYIRFDDDSKEELYDLETDPHEQINLAATQRERVEEGRRLLGIAEKRAAQLKLVHGLEGSQTMELDEAERELLRSLGYLN